MATASEGKKSEPIDKLIDAAVKLVPILTAVAGGLWGLFSYFDHLKEERHMAELQAIQQEKTRLVEAQKPFLEKQLALYFLAAQVTGRIASAYHGNSSKMEHIADAVAPDRGEFWQLYWSELAMVESREVESAMVRFGSTLDKLETLVNDATENPPQSPQGKVYLQAKYEAASADLEHAALEVAHAIRSSIEGSWGIKYEPVAGNAISSSGASASP